MAQKEPQPHRFPTAVDIIERILDKGIVVEYHARISISGIDTLVTVDARFVAASINTYRRYADALRDARMVNAAVGFAGG
jgi:gas vesicle protein GvpA/GvpJ/GvpM family